ncbi:hypothetical protein FHS72_000819 [Loktanella ponticola]|uniref:Protein kinase domain-containing protein n=1 Tax=Yoonia ponticola TaxID=1524255 RepID=A0A7W9BIK1_9RHOB|nr:serine/threonine-protein kinase [Yoonia ponticola]MBB5721212.1 hypothetical protein [Yoonia ponticola]
MGNENAAEIGAEISTDEDFVDELKPGTQLMHGQYTITSFLNAGGFGITYLAIDSLDRKIVIKECFPGAFCRRSRSIVQARSRAHQKELKSMVRLFVQEAKSLAKLSHPNIVGVHQVFEDNDTAYMALDFVEGRDMLDTMDDPDANVAPSLIRTMLIEILGAVGFIHSQDILHRDISPDNILIGQDGHPVLIDFGAAREEATKQSRVLSALSVVKDGYSPQEFYIAGSNQNASSDLYALGASFYHFMKGDTPPNSQARLAALASGDKDPYIPLKGAIEGYDDNFLAAIDKSLEVLPKNRVQSAQEWLDMIDGKHLPAPVVAAPTANVASAVAATTEATQGRSKAFILMASAAAIAIVGVGVAFSVGAFDTAEKAEVISAPAQAETQTSEAASVLDAEADAAAEALAVAQAQADAAAQAAVLAVAEAAQPQTITLVPATAHTPKPPTDIDDAHNMPTVRNGAPEKPVATVSASLIDNDMVHFASFASLGKSADFEADAFGMTETVPAFALGNEIVTKPDLDDSVVQSSWTVDLPFNASSTSSRVIGTVDLEAPSWANEGVEIDTVNGRSIVNLDGIEGALQTSVKLADETELQVNFGIRDTATGVRTEQSSVMPIIQKTELLNGLGFETRRADDTWVTTVTDVPDTANTDLKVGDEVVAYMLTSELVNDRTSLKAIMNREIADGTSLFSFAVNRDGVMWITSLDYTDSAQ